MPSNGTPGSCDAWPTPAIHASCSEIPGNRGGLSTSQQRMPARSSMRNVRSRGFFRDLPRLSFACSRCASATGNGCASCYEKQVGFTFFFVSGFSRGSTTATSDHGMIHQRRDCVHDETCPRAADQALLRGVRRQRCCGRRTGTFGWKCSRRIPPIHPAAGC